MWKNFQKFIPCGLQDISIWSDKSPFGGGLTKNWVAALYKVTFVWKNVQNGGASLDSFLKASCLERSWKNSDRLELYCTLQHIGKK